MPWGWILAGLVGSKLLGGGGGSSPPDYTQQKANFAADKRKEYQAAADAWNKQVADWGTKLGNVKTNLGTTGKNISGLNYSNLWDDPTTADNENMFGTYGDQLSGYRTTLDDIGQFSAERPVFSPTAESEWGTVNIGELPTLNNPDTALYNQLYGNIGSFETSLDNLQSQRDAEEKRIKDYRNNLLLNLPTTEIEQLGIADKTLMDAYDKQLNRSVLEASLFDSPILSQLYPEGFGTFNTNAQNLLTSIDNLRTKRAEEQKRISDFESNILSDVDDLATRYGSATIADEQSIKDMMADIESRKKSAGRFSSELGFDFYDELGELSDMERKVRNLQTDRESELDRIAGMEGNLRDTVAELQRQADAGDIYSKSRLDSISDAIQQFKSDKAGFSSLLPYDFSGINASDAQATLDTLLSDRKTELDAIRENVAGYTPELAGLNLYDEEGILGVADDLRGQKADLTRFTGGTVDDIKAEIATGLTSVDDKLAELSSKRDEIEESAKALEEKLLGQSYGATSDYDAPFSEVASMQEQVDLYNAKQALDEIDRITDELNRQKNVLASDEANVALRKQQELADILGTVGTSGMPEFGDFSTTEPITLEQYLAMLGGEEEEYPSNLMLPGTFGTNVIRA